MAGSGTPAGHHGDDDEIGAEPFAHPSAVADVHGDDSGNGRVGVVAPAGVAARPALIRGFIIMAYRLFGLTLSILAPVILHMLGICVFTLEFPLTLAFGALRLFLSIILVLKTPLFLAAVACGAVSFFGHNISTFLDARPNALCVPLSGRSLCLSFPFGNEPDKQLGEALGANIRAEDGPIPIHVGVDFPGLMEVQSRTLNELLAHSAAGSQLALSVKHTELAVQDLVFIVQASALTGKLALSRALEEFALEAKAVGRHLQFLSASLDSVVDKYVCSSVLRGSIYSSFTTSVLAFDDYALRKLSASRDPGTLDVQATTVHTFQAAMDVLASEVANVLADATAVGSALDGLEEKLSVIQTLTAQESFGAGVAVAEQASSFWAFLNVRRRLAHRIQVLDGLHAYRRRSSSHVTATIQTLVMIEADLSGLHKKLAARQTDGGALPIEVHIASIERSVQRMQEERLRARAPAGGESEGAVGITAVGRL